MVWVARHCSTNRRAKSSFRPGGFGFVLNPDLQVARPSASEHLVVIKIPQGSQVFVARFFPACISRQIVRFQPKLRRQKTRDFQWNDLTRS